MGSEPLTAAEGVVAMEAMEESTTNWVTCPLCGERAFSLSLSRADLLRRHQETACPHSPEANSFIDLREDEATVVVLDAAETAVSAQ
ncbi:MAG TPA: hypothetical protein VFA11_13550 [Acidimicrobiales bacterium]|nr:hypothetical protein [Acidimicrobiales bacterium]